MTSRVFFSYKSQATRNQSWNFFHRTPASHAHILNDCSLETQSTKTNKKFTSLFLFRFFFSFQNKRDQFLECDSYKSHSNQRFQHPPLHNMSHQSLNGSKNSPPTSPANSKYQYQSTSTKLLLEEILNNTKNSDKLPMIVRPMYGGYWIDCGNVEEKNGYNDDNNNNQPRFKIELNDSARCYRQHFFGREHSNVIGFDDELGPVLMSIKAESIANQPHLRVLLRLKSGTFRDFGIVQTIAIKLFKASSFKELNLSNTSS